MSVSSLGSSSGLYQWLQQIAANGQSNAAGQTTATAAGQDTDGDTNGSTTSSASGSSSSVGGASGHHHHGHGGKGITSQIESAITSALNSSTSTSDPNQTIQDAIKNLLNPNGSTAAANGTTQDKPNDGDGDDKTPAAAAQNTVQGSSQFAQQQAAFSQLLQSYGVDPAQFQKDVQAALQSSQGGQPDFSQIFKSFPPGSIINTTG